MQWQRLMHYKCPKCGLDLYKDDPGVNCSSINTPTPCGFFIKKERLEKIRQDMAKPKSRCGGVFFNSGQGPIKQ